MLFFFLYIKDITIVHVHKNDKPLSVAVTVHNKKLCNSKWYMYEVNLSCTSNYWLMNIVIIINLVLF